ncbi:tyrosine-type recombinase/integrase [Shewanella sp. Isolate11]|uniref:tyrosine-type recombinase/integrase n=1 Tax=Shewanella sp. Isolate11 TaxID=2908530 RepID=UPI001EFDD664|nr:tyrosine-type recombinase/integrase [Shewanella sp. Isolate11]MCG9697443.1 tyrosine-type recombinase/integrase [Shewanella sp. Isolate11]
MASGVDVGQLNDAALRRWLRGGVTRDYRDPRFPDLRLRASADRSKASVFLVVHECGDTRWEKLANWPSVCIKTLCKELPVMLAERSAGKMVTGQFVSVADVLVWYRDHIKDNTTYSHSWRANVKSLIGRHLLPRMGDVAIAKLSFMEVDEMLVKTMLKDEFSPNYIREAVNKLKAAFSAATKLRMIGSNPIAGYQVTDSIKLNSAKDTRLFESDLAELFARLSTSPMPVTMMFVLMMMFGTRINETRQARWAYFAGDMWVIPARHAKNKQEHRLPLTNAAKSLLNHYKRWQLKYVGKRSCLFPGVNGPISIRTAHEWNTQIRFKHFTSHDLRILFRTMLADLGVDTMIGERLVNHALPVLLRTYVKSTLDKGMSQALEQYHAYLIEQGFSSIAPEILPRSIGDHGNTQTQMSSGWV